MGEKFIGVKGYKGVCVCVCVSLWAWVGWFGGGCVGKCFRFKLGDWEKGKKTAKNDICKL